MNVLLISAYELGRQPFGLASPAAWLRQAGARVVCFDLSRETLPAEAVSVADLIAFYVPMHTATRLAVALLPSVREMNPHAHICFYGLYAPVNEAYLRGLGVETILGGEFEEGLRSLAAQLSKKEAAPSTSLPPQQEPVISLARQNFITPDRADLPALEKYARLVMPSGEKRDVGYTEASRGCKHFCRHCPIVPVYRGAFRVIARDVVLADIRQQVASGAQHITFGDPDFFNGIGHAIPLIEAVHREFPRLTYDVTIKVEHLLKHENCIPQLCDTGCLFVTSAVESIDDAVLQKLQKNHTRAHFLLAVEMLRKADLAFQPTFVPFTPWTTIEGYCELLELLREHNLVENVAPIQLAIRLLIPAGSLLLELAEIRGGVGAFDGAALVYPWNHTEPRLDRLCETIQGIVHSGEKQRLSRSRIFERIEDAAFDEADDSATGRRSAHDGISKRATPILAARATVPYLDEPWYC